MNLDFNFWQIDILVCRYFDWSKFWHNITFEFLFDHSTGECIEASEAGTIQFP